MFQQQYNSAETVQPKYLAVIVEPEVETSALYSAHLEAAGIAAMVCTRIASALEYIRKAQPHVVILNPDGLADKHYQQLEAELKAQPQLLLVTVGEHLAEYDMDRLMALGVSCHINRHFSKPRDISATVLELLGARG